jgi:hypothetical protein
MVSRSIQITAALVVLLAGALGVRALIARSGMLDHSPLVAAVKPSIDIQFVDIIPRDFRNFHATACNVMASISNASRYHINDLMFRVENSEFRFGGINANERLDRWNVGSIELTDVDSSCADQALSILNTIAHMSPGACAADDLSQDECRSLVRFSTRMDRQTIAGIRYDEFEMGRRNMVAIEVEIPWEISYITDHIDNRKTTAEGRGGATTNDVVVLRDTTARYYVGDGPQVGWHDAPYEKCSRLSVLNNAGLAALKASTAQNADAYRGIPSGYVWYARPTNGSVWYGQVRIADIAPSIFVAKCDAATGFAELKMPLFHADGAPRVVK